MFKLRVKNFRGFEDETFDFSRINILIGENSAGKSSILKFLLALKQSLQIPYSQDYNLTLSGNEADLGNYYETIYNHETERNLGFAFEFGEDYPAHFIKNNSLDNAAMSKEDYQQGMKVYNHIAKLSSSIKIEVELNKDLSKPYKLRLILNNDEIGKFEIAFPENTNETVKKTANFIHRKFAYSLLFESKYHNESFLIKNIEYQKEGFLATPRIESFAQQYSKHYPKNDLVMILYMIFMLNTQGYLESKLRKIKYINPLLHITEDRIYLNKDRRVIKQIKTIYDFIEFMDSKEATKEYQESLTTLLADFGLADEFYIKKTDSTKELRLKLNGVDNNIKDVGFGVSLQFLIFAQTILSESKGGEVLLIEQPEVHLHPRLQAKFIETLLKIGRHNTYFIETHSEHIIRMLQVLVKKQKYDIKSKDVSIQYFRKDGANMVKSNHKIHPDTGKLQPKFPKGFYDVSYNLAFQLTD